MSARAKPPVEALSRAAWDRVEAGLFERLDHGEHRRLVSAVAPRARRWRWWGVAPAAAALAVIALRSQLGWLAQPPLPAPAAQLGPAPAAQAAPITHITTTDAPTRTTIGEATLTLGVRSELRFTGSDAEGWLVLLDRGEVECEVAPRHGRPPFVVQAGETRVTVVGTRFTVLREGRGERVRVREGHVRVSSGAREQLLGPGQVWPDEPPLIASESLPELRAPVPETRAARGKPAAQRSARAPERRARILPATAGSLRDPAARFATAAGLEASDPEAASALYRELGAGRGPWAANALFARARLELERGRTARAAQLLRRYRERHPTGSNRADVDALLQRLGAREH